MPPTDSAAGGQIDHIFDDVEDSIGASVEQNYVPFDDDPFPILG
jgi:hypothetical protein